MVAKDEMLPLLAAACPSFAETWQTSGRTDEFAAVFKVVESLHLEGEHYVREAVTIGLLEGIQNLCSHIPLDSEVFGPWLLPETRSW
jgi:hypothetical protein